MKDESRKTLVLGASPNPQRYSFMAVKELQAHHHPVVAIGKKPGVIENVSILTNHPPLENIHTVTLYLNSEHQKEYYDYILSLQPKRIIFNPGAENKELFLLAKQHGIEPVEACSLVMLHTGQY
jgi:predicted CoA-binding protein